MDEYLEELLNLSVYLSDKTYEFTSNTDLQAEHIGENHFSMLTMIQNNLKSIDIVIERLKNRSGLVKTKSSSLIMASLSIPETIQFFLIGRMLKNTETKEKFISETNNLSGLNKFLAFHEKFQAKQGTDYFQNLEILESLMRKYLKKSNKIIENLDYSYSSAARFVHQITNWISEQSEIHATRKKISKEELYFPKIELTKSISVQDYGHKRDLLADDYKVTSVENSALDYGKVYESADKAVFDIENGSSLLIGGFSIVGSPESLLKAIHRKKINNLKIYSCLAGTNQSGIGLLVRDKMVSSAIVSHIGTNTELERQYLNGEIELEFITQGSLVEKFRAGSAGIHSFYTKSGIGTFVEKGHVPIKFALGGKEVEKYSNPRDLLVECGKKYFLEKAIKGDFGIIKAWKGDTMGNLIYKKTAQNSNPDIAGSCKITIAEVEEIVPAGTLDPNQIHTPGILIQRIYKSDSRIKLIERLTFSKNGEVRIPGTVDQIRKRERIGKRAAKEIQDGMNVNLGLGIPTIIPNYLPKNIKMTLHGENGILGIGSYPREGQEDADLVNASRETISFALGASTFASSTSFSIIRGNHLDLTILGGLQVSENGDLANWLVPGVKVKGMGGAMDLVSSSSKCIVCMEHLNYGNLKVLSKCTLPLTGKRVVNMLITEYGVFEFRKDSGMILTEISDEITLEELQRHTQARFTVDPDLKIMQQ